MVQNLRQLPGSVPLLAVTAKSDALSVQPWKIRSCLKRDARDQR